MLRFEKVSFEQFYKDYIKAFGDISKSDLLDIYDNIKLPQRATVGSAGYDIYSIKDFILDPGKDILLPTGLRVVMDMEYALMILPKSGIGTTYRLQLDNTIGLIDSDYSNSDNAGHIFIKLTNDSKQAKVFNSRAGSAIVQCVFIKYGVIDDDNASTKRNGGFGSTDK